MSNTPPMGWATRLHNYAAQNGGGWVRLTPRQFRRWNKKHRAELRRARPGLALLPAADEGGTGG